MAAREIARMGAQVLNEPALAVEDPTDGEVALLVADMLETMRAAGGVGLAATQIRVPKRVVIFEVPAQRTADGVAMPLTTLVNPTWEPLGPELEEAYEACLSVPGLTGVVPRYRRIGYRGYDLAGRPIAREAEGFHARVVQHEIDHLDGMLYPLRMTSLSTLAFVDELRRTAAAEREVEAA